MLLHTYYVVVIVNIVINVKAQKVVKSFYACIKGFEVNGNLIGIVKRIAVD